jgi:hypothetical protein
MIKVNLNKAKEIHKENLRFARSQEFKNLDIEFMRSLEVEDVQKIEEIANLKQQLRDITKSPEIDSAESVEDLKRHWPEILNCPNLYDINNIQ